MFVYSPKVSCRLRTEFKRTTFDRQIILASCLKIVLVSLSHISCKVFQLLFWNYLLRFLIMYYISANLLLISHLRLDLPVSHSFIFTRDSISAVGPSPQATCRIILEEKDRGRQDIKFIHMSTYKAATVVWD